MTRSIAIPVAIALLLTGCLTGGWRSQVDKGSTSAAAEDGGLCAICAERFSKEVVEASSLGDTPNVHRCGNIVFAGQPSEADLERAADSGFREVVTLRTAPEVTSFDERAVVESAGMRYAEIPFRSPDSLTNEVFDSIRLKLSEAAGSKELVLLHCGSANRVGAVWIPWRVLDCGIPIEQALREDDEIGLRTVAYRQRAIEHVEVKRSRS